MFSISPIDQPRFTTPQVAEAAGVTFATLTSQIRRGEITLGSLSRIEAELINQGPGKIRLWSARRAIHIALTEALVRVGIPVKTASKLAVQFTDMGGVDNGGLADESLPEPRLAGHLRPEGSVFRVLFPADGGEPVASVDRADSLPSPFYRDNNRFASVVLIDLDDLTERTLARLGVAKDEEMARRALIRLGATQETA